MSLSGGLQSVSNTLTGNDNQDLILNSVTAVYGDFTNLTADNITYTNVNTPGVISCGGINNSGDYVGSYLSLNNNTIALGLAASSINPGAANIAIGIAAGQNNQGQYSVGVGFGACQLNQGQYSVGIGYQSGKNLQGNSSIAIGYQAGYTLQNINSIAIGVNAGHFTQSYSSIAIGYQAAYAQQNNSSVAIGHQAAYTGQGFESVAIGNLAGYTRQSDFAIAIGSRAGQTNQGDFSICIGHDSEATGDYSVALGTNSVAIGSHNISIGTVNETINLNGNTTLPILNSTTINNSAIINCGGLSATSTQDYNIHTPTLGSIISNGGINVSKNIYSQNFQTNNSSYLYGLISTTYGGNQVNINVLDVPYNVYDISGNISGNKIYTMTCNSAFDRTVNISSPIGMRVYTSVGRTGTTSTSYTFNITTTNLNLVVNKNGSYYSTVPITMYDPSSFNFTYVGTANGLQTVYFYIFISTGYAQFTPTADTLNVTNTYDFYVTATLTYSAVGTLATFGTMSFQFYANSTGFVINKGEYQCTLNCSTGSGGHNEHPAKVYCDASFPYSSGTSITNVLNCNNIKMLSSGVITKETINSPFDSTYKPYLTIRDCGVFMWNGSSTFPIYFTIPSYINFFSSTPGNATTIPVASGVGGSGGYGLYQRLDIADIDDEYLVHPDYGIIVYNGLNFTGGTMINYENTTNEISFVSSTSGNNNKGASCQLYYKGVEITSY